MIYLHAYFNCILNTKKCIPRGLSSYSKSQYQTRHLHIYSQCYKNWVYKESGEAINSWGARVCFNICIISVAIRHVHLKHLFLSVCNGMIISGLVTSKT